MKTRIHDLKYVYIKYKGKKIQCHPDSWMATFKKPIQDFSNDELHEVIRRSCLH